MSENGSPANVDARTVVGFGREWAQFDQSQLPREEAAAHFGRYFALVPWEELPDDAVAVDIGCGSGRWAALVGELVPNLVCIDPSSDALAVARRTLHDRPGVTFAQAEVGSLPIADESADLVYSLGVLHHVPDTARAIAECARKVKPGGFLLLYLYYRFDDRPAWFRALWRCSDVLRRAIALSPFALRRRVTDIIALTVYWPLARTARLAARRGHDVRNMPLSFYRDTSLYTMRTDALDRFGTALEHRFTRPEITAMLQDAGLRDIRFRDGEPYWCVLGRKRD